MWICDDCGRKYGKSRFHLSTWHSGICQWCNERTAVTEDRDYGYPELPGNLKKIGDRAIEYITKMTHPAVIDIAMNAIAEIEQLQQENIDLKKIIKDNKDDTSL